MSNEYANERGKSDTLSEYQMMISNVIYCYQFDINMYIFF